MNKNNQNKQASDSGTAKEAARVVPYIGARKIEEMMEKEEKYYIIDAFAHTQLGIEKILWDRIVESFETKRAKAVRQAIEESGKGEDKYYTTTRELIKWAHFLGAISDNEYYDLKCFNTGRNKIMHGHGEWWHLRQKNKAALKKGIQFLRENGFE